MKLFNKENKENIDKNIVESNDSPVITIRKKNLGDLIRKEVSNLESFEINDETLKNAGSWPLIVKFISILLLNVSIVFLANQFYFKSAQMAYDKAVKEEKTLYSGVIFKIKQTAGLNEYKKKVEELEKSFEKQLSQLPTDIEMDGLLKDITETGINNGIEFKKFQMLKKVHSEFYTENPIEIILSGTYHSLANFISEVSNLDRIVTFHDFSLSKQDPEDDESLLELKIIAKTYKYRSKAEILEVENEK